MAKLAQRATPGLSLTLLVGAAVLLNYIDRGTVGVAAPLLKTELGLSNTAFGIAISAFFWVYAPIQLGIGWLCDRVPVYRLLGAGLALWALATMAMGLVGSIGALVALRLLLGLGESVAFPGSSKIICRHVPIERRGLANAVVASGIALGPAVGTFVGGFIMVRYGWRPMFFVFGLLTLLWLGPWSLAVRSLPSAPEGHQARVPAMRLLRTRALWATSAGHFAVNYGFYFVLSWLPLYLVNSRGYDIWTMTLLASLAYVAQAVTALSLGWICDRGVAGGRDAGAICRVLLIGGVSLLGVTIVGIFYSASILALAANLVLLGIAMGPCSTYLYVMAQLFAGPRAAGTYVGVQNAIGNFAGIVGPIVTGVIVDWTGSFMSAFLVAGAICGLGTLIFAFAVPKIEPLDLD